MNALRTIRAIATLGILGVLIVGITGCGGDDPAEEAMTDPTAVLANFERQRRRHDPVAFTEVDLGEYFVTMLVPDHGMYSVRFHLYGVVDERQQEELETALTTRDRRMRDAVISTVRKTSLEHLGEAKLSWLKSELIPVINGSLKTQSLRDVVFGDYALEKT